VDAEINKENMTTFDFKSEYLLDTSENFRPLGGKADHIPRRSQGGFKSFDMTNHQSRTAKTVEEILVTGDNTPRKHQVNGRRIGVPRTPLASNAVSITQNFKIDPKIFPFNKNKNIRSGSQAKQRTEASDDRKGSILGLEIKSTEYMQSQTASSTKRSKILPLHLMKSNPLQNQSQNQERIITINNYIPSMLDCYKKNKKKYLLSPQKMNNHQIIKDSFHNYYDTSAHTPLVRTLKRINGKCQYDKHVMNFMNELNEPPVTSDTDERVLNHFLNKNYNNKPKIALPSRKTNSNQDKTELINRFINQSMSSNISAGVTMTVSKMKISEEKSHVIERSPDRGISLAGKRKLKPAVEIQNFVMKK